jgi:hypothetical protein
MTSIPFRAPSRNRQRLPNRRGCELIDTYFRSSKYTISIGRFANGAIAEAFVDPARFGSDAAADSIDTAIIISLSLQHRVSVEALRRSISRIEGGALGSFVGHVLDTLAQEEERGRQS